MEELKKLENKITDMQFQIDDLKNTRDPLRANQRIDLLQQQLSDFGVKIDEMNQKLNSYAKDDRYIEVFSDEEFKTLYQNSGLSSKDVANLMKAHEKFKDMDSTPPTISKIINGERGSVELRSYLGKQFRFAITQRKTV